jgi:hypothetical protein
MLLGLISAVLAWQIKDMIDVHRFQKQIDHLLTDMRKTQTFALTYQTDFDLRIFKQDDQFFYTISTDEPIKNLPLKKPKALPGVVNLTFNNDDLNTLDFRVYSSGRIEPLGVVGFLPKQTTEELEGLWLDLRTPIQINLMQQP